MPVMKVMKKAIIVSEVDVPQWVIDDLSSPDGELFISRNNSEWTYILDNETGKEYDFKTETYWYEDEEYDTVGLIEDKPIVLTM